MRVVMMLDPVVITVVLAALADVTIRTFAVAVG